ncbi:outer membrane lipoprotein chaperone LolA [Chromatium okenii]|uniref:outer membrane lipoprotein chaperone LolA n=1 Tax=Chromatium okenii TaxID=61644 RepID=UPI001F5B018E|nr:outer membrane lipoprotein chaperone LolA [Chromatium okenii]
MLRSIYGIGVLLALGINSASAAETNLVERYLADLNTLVADFEQYTFNADRSQMLEARGTFYLQRPGRFRWEYASPTAQVIIADGKRVYVHDLDLQQISHQEQNEALRGTPALLLANREPIATHFVVKAIASTDGRDWVELTPKDTDTDIVRIELGFGADTLDSLIMQDSFGQETRLNFTNARRNTTLKAELFKIEQRAVDDFFQMD